MVGGVFCKSHGKMHTECFEGEVFIYLGSGRISRFRNGNFPEKCEAGGSQQCCVLTNKRRLVICRDIRKLHRRRFKDFFSLSPGFPC